MVLEPSIGNVRPVNIEEEMRSAYLDYAMSVIVARALPDVRDGLKPVQRRILYAMDQTGLRPGTSYKKCATVVGEVLGKYHPHGDDPVYDALVRLAQPFSMRYPLIDGQGNFGSVDGDPPAAYRYTEARLTRIAMELLADIEKETVDFFPNFDGEHLEPQPLPAKLPNLLANGATGIAVGMATNIPPHNLSEICDAVSTLIDEPETTMEELSNIIKGPDFPTGGLIFRYETIRVPSTNGEGPTVEQRDAIRTSQEGKGRVVMRARVHVEELTKGNRNHQIIVTELPYQTNKATLIEKIAGLVRSKRIDGIADLRDESDRHGMRIVIELKRESQPRSVLNALYKMSAMQSAFAVNMVALVDGQPRTVSIKKILESYIGHRQEVIRRRSEFDLKKAQARAHVLEGLLKAIDMLDKVIKAIRSSPSAEEAKARLMRAPFKLTDIQAQAVLDMQLRRLARLERNKIEEEYGELIQQIAYLEDLLANPHKIDLLIKDDAIEIKEKYGDDRRTLIMDQEAEEFSAEDMVAHQEVVVSLSKRGFIKRIPLSTYRAQRRGGVGVIGMKTRDDDAVRHLVVADTHDRLIFFTDRGRCFQLKAYELADESRVAKGESIMQLITLDQKEQVTAVVRVAADEGKSFMVMATQSGEVKKTPLQKFDNVRRDGLIAMDLEPEDEFVSAKLANDEDDMILVTAKGQALRFTVKSLRSASRLSGGVRGIRLAKDDSVVGMEPALEGEALLVASELGMGKRTPVDDYPTQGRGGQGVITFKTNPRSGDLVRARTVHPDYELMLVSEEGIILRTPVNHISLQGRSTQGVTLMDVSRGDRVSAIAVVDMQREFMAKDLPTGATDGTNGADGASDVTKKKASKSKTTKATKPKSAKPAAKKAKPDAKAKGNARTDKGPKDKKSK